MWEEISRNKPRLDQPNVVTWFSCRATEINIKRSNLLVLYSVAGWFSKAFTIASAARSLDNSQWLSLKIHKYTVCIFHMPVTSHSGAEPSPNFLRLVSSCSPFAASTCVAWTHACTASATGTDSTPARPVEPPGAYQKQELAEYFVRKQSNGRTERSTNSTCFRFTEPTYH